MPAQHRELAGNGDGGDLMTPPRPDAHEEGVQRPGRLGRRPGGLDQHGAGMAAADLADAAVLGSAEPRLAHPRVQAEIAHQLLRAGEAADVADRRHEPGGYREIDAGDRDQALDRCIVERALGDLLVKHAEVLAQPVQLAHVALDRGPLVIRQRLAGEPGATEAPEQIGVRTARDQMRVQDRMHLVLDPRAMADHLVAPRHQPA